MRILFLAHRIPYPPNKGDKIRSWNVLRHLAAKHDVRVATLIDDAADVEYLPVLARQGWDVLHERIDQPLRKLWSLRELAASGPVTARYFHVPKLQARIDALVDEFAPDAIVCSSSPTAEYVFRSRHRAGRLKAAFKVMDLMDVDSRKWAQYADGRNAAAAWLYRLEARRLADYERRIYEAFDRVLLVSEQEKGLFPLEDCARKLCAMRNGVDLDYFRPQSRAADTRPPTLVFTGMMDYWPNVDGMKWFIHEVLPRVRRDVPDVVVQVVGGRPGRDVQAWQRDGVVVTGFVPDVRDYVAEADVCVVPLRIARGIQNKLLEAMAMGKAVVCTPQAFEGTDADDGREVVVAADADDFAVRTVELLRDSERATAIGRAARAFAERRFSWAAHLAALDDMLDRAAGTVPRAVGEHGS